MTDAVVVGVNGERVLSRWCSARARCGTCGWVVSMTGETFAEVEAFLRARLKEHRQIHTATPTEQPS
jgi:hypothetical protein